jgi:2-methylaconitate cis-trans-isomerase PrpF
VRREGDAWTAAHATVYRTARRLMDGAVYVRASMIRRDERGWGGLS